MVYLGLKSFLRPSGGSGEGRLDFYHAPSARPSAPYNDALAGITQNWQTISRSGRTITLFSRKAHILYSPNNSLTCNDIISALLLTKSKINTRSKVCLSWKTIEINHVVPNGLVALKYSSKNRILFFLCVKYH